MTHWIVTLEKRPGNASRITIATVAVITLMGIAGAVAANARPQTHDAKIASYAFDVEAGDPPGTLAKLKLAAKLAAEGPKCAEVTLAAYVPRAQRRPGQENKPYFVQCMTQKGKTSGIGGYGVYFSNAELKARKVKNRTPPIAKSRALLLCRKAILRRLRYPSSAHFSAWTAYVSHSGTVNREVMLNFTALNRVGNRIPQRGKCYVRPDGRTDVIALMNR